MLYLVNLKFVERNLVEICRAEGGQKAGRKAGWKAGQKVFGEKEFTPVLLLFFGVNS